MQSDSSYKSSISEGLIIPKVQYPKDCTENDKRSPHIHQENIFYSVLYNFLACKNRKTDNSITKLFPKESSSQNDSDKDRKLKNLDFVLKLESDVPSFLSSQSDSKFSSISTSVDSDQLTKQENDFDLESFSLRISSASKKIQKMESKKLDKRIEMQKNWLPITINGFAIWTGQQGQLVEQLIQEMRAGAIVSSAEVLTYNYTNIDRKGTPADHKVDSSKKQYKITSQKKFSQVFNPQPEDSTKLLTIKTLLRKMLNRFLSDFSGQFLDSCRSKAENKSYWLQHNDSIKAKILGFIKDGNGSF